MFYWKQKTEFETTIEEEMLNCKDVNKVVIASAYLSREGVRILREVKDTYSLGKEDITLYLSAQFSADKPYEILEQLSNICVVKIIFDHSFHPKVYYLQGNPDKLIYGSSNFTQGGMVNNVEFNFIGSPSPDEINSITSFFKYCDFIANEVNADVIQYYKNNQDRIEKLHHTQKKLTVTLTGYTRQDDAFLPDDYDLDNYYFGYVDYETFFPRNRKKNVKEIKEKRKRVQDKMLDIHKKIYPSIKKLGIAHHKRKENITSLIIPHTINQHSVGWLGVRYGKTPMEIEVLNTGKDKDEDIYGFQKHGCLQYSIGSNGFEINLFLAVRHGAVDRAYLHEHLEKLKPTIEYELQKLKGCGMGWIIWDSNNNEQFTFEVDNEEPSAFCDFFKANDKQGRESYLQKYYKPNDVILQTKETTCKEIIRVMKVLLPLYNTMVWRPFLNKTNR